MTRPWDSIVWWEVRRILFNGVVLVAGLLSVFAVVGLGGTMVPPGQDVIEPVMLFVLVAGYAVAANLFYTLGWLTELLWSGGDTSKTAARRPLIFRLGLIASTVLTLAPGLLMLLFWAAFHLR
jgi:hypothetical protein